VRAPRASITGIDISKAMLDRLRAKFPDAEDRLRLIRGSFLDADLGEKTYDVVVSSMALHHWMPDRKLGLYERIRRSLRPSGLFVNGDFIRGAEMRNPFRRFPAQRSAPKMIWFTSTIRFPSIRRWSFFDEAASVRSTWSSAWNGRPSSLAAVRPRLGVVIRAYASK